MNNTITESKLLEQIAQLTDQVSGLIERFDLQFSEQPKPTRANVQPLTDAWKALGYKSYKACWRKIGGKHYREGREAIDRRRVGAAVPDWHLDIAACEARDRTIAAKRK